MIVLRSWKDKRIYSSSPSSQKEYKLRSYYIQNIVPEWVTSLSENGEYELDLAFQFQYQWEKRFHEMWSELTELEQRRIKPIHPPYTEESVATFLQLLQQTIENRGLLSSLSSMLPDILEDTEFPIQALKSAEVLDRLDRGEHPVLFSWMKVLEGGAFQMGEGTGVHSVQLSHSFAIGKYPVTQGLWGTLMWMNPSYFRSFCQPVEKVSWFDCISFCNKLSEREGLQKAYTINGQHVRCDFTSDGYRLPTEAEWEFAAKSAMNTIYSGGNHADDVAWTAENAGIAGPRSVGQKNANGFGLFDMSGNVWEWCWDWYAKANLESTVNPTGPTHGEIRLIKGVAWDCGSSVATVAFRHGQDPSSQSNNRGFRVCRTIHS